MTKTGGPDLMVAVTSSVPAEKNLKPLTSEVLPRHAPSCSPVKTGLAETRRVNEARGASRPVQRGRWYYLARPALTGPAAPPRYGLAVGQRDTVERTPGRRLRSEQRPPTVIREWGRGANGHPVVHPYVEGESDWNDNKQHATIHNGLPLYHWAGPRRARVS